MIFYARCIVSSLTFLFYRNFWLNPNLFILYH